MYCQSYYRPCLSALFHSSQPGNNSNILEVDNSRSSQILPESVASHASAYIQWELTKLDQMITNLTKFWKVFRCFFDIVDNVGKGHQSLAKYLVMIPTSSIMSQNNLKGICCSACFLYADVPSFLPHFVLQSTTPNLRGGKKSGGSWQQVCSSTALRLLWAKLAFKIISDDLCLEMPFGKIWKNAYNWQQVCSSTAVTFCKIGIHPE